MVRRHVTALLLQRKAQFSVTHGNCISLGNDRVDLELHPQALDEVLPNGTDLVDLSPAEDASGKRIRS